MSRRYHETATLCVLLRGAARDILGSRTIEYKPGTVVYLPPGEAHSHQFGRFGMVGLVIEVPTSRLQTDLNLDYASEIRCQDNPVLLADCALLLQRLHNPRVDDAELEERCVSLLLALEKQQDRVANSDGVDRVRKFLDECFLERHSLAELSAVAGLHPAYLVNAFRKRVGCTMGQYRRRRCIGFMIERIWNSHDSLADVAIQAGFYDQSDCTNTLRKILQITPGQVRTLMSFGSSSNE